MAAPKELKLCSPVGAEAIIYHWPLSRGRCYSGAVEIVETIRFVCDTCPELRFVTDKMLSSNFDYNSYDSLKTLCDKFNKAAQAYKNLNKGTSKFPANVFASVPLLRHIVQQVYNRSVTEPEKLNNYEPFTPAVYGETSFDLVAKMIELVKPSEEDVFIDLGSGVGQVVVQMAGGSRVKKCIGIEKSEVPAAYARTVDFEFRKWMKWFGKTYNDFELIEGDFLDPKWREMIMGCSLIFVNNFAFGPEVDHKLKSIFAEMHDGTKIVSSKAFCPLNFRISDRNLSDIGTIMTVRELWSQTGNVSWTDKPVTYYLHVIDRKKLEDYFATMRNNGGGNGSNGSRPELRRSGSKASCQSWSSRESACSNAEVIASIEQITVSNEDHDPFIGTTTRRQYQSWIAQQKKGSGPSATSSKSSPNVSKRSDQFTPTPPAPSVSANRRPSETTNESEEEQGEDDEEDEDDAEEEEEEQDEDGDGKGRSSASGRTSLRRPGGPRKSQAALKAQQAKKKYQKHRRPGRQSLKKLQKKKTQEWIGILDLFHQQTVSVSAVDREAIYRQSAARNVQGQQCDTRPPLCVMPQSSTTGEGLSSAAIMAKIEAPLDGFVARMKTDIQTFVLYMSTPQYRAQLMESIERESVRQHTLRERGMQLERQISRLQEEGVQLLRARMLEVGIQAETPAELLNKAKEIVMDHQALQNRANSLDSELRNLEKQNEYLVSLARERDEQVIRSGVLQNMGYPNNISADEVKSSILGEIGLLFNRRRALLVEMNRFENEIHNLESNIPAAANTEILLNQLPPASMIISTVTAAPTTITSGILPAVTPISSSEMAPASVQATARKRAPTSTPRRRSMTGKGNRGKPKPVPAEEPSKAAPSAPTPTTTPAEGSQEDIEEKIRDIVRKALSVDNAAKRAEKERKARTAERKRGGSKGSMDGGNGEKVVKTGPVPKSTKPGDQSPEKRRKDTDLAAIDQTISETISNYTSFGIGPQTDERPHSQVSSATESAPSDHEDFQSRDHSESKTSPGVGNEQQKGITEVDTNIMGSSVMDTSAIASSIGRSVATSTIHRPSSVPSAIHKQFSISALIAAASPSPYPRVTSAFARIECLPVTTSARTVRLEETSSQGSDINSAADSGFSSENRAPGGGVGFGVGSGPGVGFGSGPGHGVEVGSGPGHGVGFGPGLGVGSGHGVGVGFGPGHGHGTLLEHGPGPGPADGVGLEKADESTTASIPYVSEFSGSSANVGQPGSPHSFSNPGNPIFEATTARKEDDYRNPFKGTSNTGNPGNPHDYSNPGNPSTPEENDAMEPKLLQPFRIPRRTAKEPTAEESPDTRSPLAHVGFLKREDTGSSWMPTMPGTKKRRRDQDISPSKKRYVTPDTTATPFDKIMNTMIVPAAAVAGKKCSKSRSVHSETSSGSSRKRGEPLSSSGSVATTLTKELLEKHAAACQDVHSFAEKGLMEVLLEHKMMAGRIESHSQIASKLRFTTPKPAVVGPSTPPGSQRGVSTAAAPATGGATNRRGPKTPEYTPPTSPTPSGRSNSRFSRRSNYSGVSALEPTDSQNDQQSVPQAPALVSDQRESRSPSSTNNARTLETLARLTNIDASQLAKCLNEDALRTLQGVDPALLVATLSTLLTTVVKSVQRPNASNTDEGPSNRRQEDTGRPSGRDKSEELVTSTSMVEDKGHPPQHHQPQPVEMEIASSSHSGTPAPPPDHDSNQKLQSDEKSPFQQSEQQQPNPQFQPHQLFQPLFSIPPPALGLGMPNSTPMNMPTPTPMTLPAPPPPLVAPPPLPPIPEPLQQQQELIRNFLLLMQVMKGPSMAVEGGMVHLEGGMRDSARFMKDYYHGDERMRRRSPEPAFTMPPPPRPVRIDYTFPSPRELAVLGSTPPAPAPFPEVQFRHGPSPTPPPTMPYQNTDSFRMMHPPFPAGMPPQPLMRPSMQPAGGGIPSLLDLEQPCPPPFGGAPPPRRGMRQNRGTGRIFRQ